MKNIITVLCVLISSCSLLAVPRNNYLASPQKIEVSGNKVILTFKLPCKNEYPSEWAGSLVAVSDDEGDMAVGLGVILSKESCEKGPNKIFQFEYDLKQTGITQSEINNGATFEPIDLLK